MSTIHIDRIRSEAAKIANEEDAELWRWFCGLYEDRRIRWCHSGRGWLVTVDHRHVATEFDFDAAMRSAHRRHASLDTRRNA
ncbi:hypothetical protein C5O80_31205 [Burkholderia sp. SRS-46]|nr:hypothetical protein C5O80_31205 [Burkholderia sp. SRS-46]